MFNSETNKTFFNQIAENEFEELPGKKSRTESMPLMLIWLAESHFKLVL